MTSKDINTGGPAFPTGTAFQGMTLLDYFAAKAMQGLLAGTVRADTVWSMDQVAETSYNMAQAMLKAKNV